MTFISKVLCFLLTKQDFQSPLFLTKASILTDYAYEGPLFLTDYAYEGPLFLLIVHINDLYFLLTMHMKDLYFLLRCLFLLTMCTNVLYSY